MSKNKQQSNSTPLKKKKNAKHNSTPAKNQKPMQFDCSIWQPIYDPELNFQQGIIDYGEYNMLNALIHSGLSAKEAYDLSGINIGFEFESNEDIKHESESNDPNTHDLMLKLKNLPTFTIKPIMFYDFDTVTEIKENKRTLTSIAITTFNHTNFEITKIDYKTRSLNANELDDNGNQIRQLTEELPCIPGDILNVDNIQGLSSDLLLLAVTDVRAERLHALKIINADLWDKAHKDAHLKWEANPWVWTIHFSIIKDLCIYRGKIKNEKDKKQADWVYGIHFKTTNKTEKHYIISYDETRKINTNYEVHACTIGRLTTLIDINGYPIFKNDLLKLKTPNNTTLTSADNPTTTLVVKINDDTLELHDENGLWKSLKPLIELKTEDNFIYNTEATICGYKDADPLTI